MLERVVVSDTKHETRRWHMMKPGITVVHFQDLKNPISERVIIIIETMHEMYFVLLAIII